MVVPPARWFMGRRVRQRLIAVPREHQERGPGFRGTRGGNFVTEKHVMVNSYIQKICVVLCMLKTSEASREFNVEGLAKKREKALISEAEPPWTEIQEASVPRARRGR